MQEAILWYSGAAFGPRPPPFFGCQTRNLSATSQQPSLWLYTKHLMHMFSYFWIRGSSTFGKYSIFHSRQGFLLITLLLDMLYCLLFKASQVIDSLTCVPNFLISDFYLNLLFNFKFGLSLDLSCLMSSIFIIILIIRVIKTTCSNNTILMVELEGKLP